MHAPRASYEAAVKSLGAFYLPPPTRPHRRYLNAFGPKQADSANLYALSSEIPANAAKEIAMNAMRQAQLAHDFASPSEDMDFLETTAGSNWLDSSVNALLEGIDTPEAEVDELDTKLADLFLSKIAQLSECDENALGRLVRLVLNYEPGPAMRELRCILGDGEPDREAAENLLKPKAAQAESRITKENAEDQAARMESAA